jgi:hypothetical protein
MMDDLHDSLRHDNLGANIMRDNARRRGAFVQLRSSAQK